jgi:hypothetical protein
MLALPVALLPREIAVQVWTAIDGAAIVASLILLYLLLAPRHRLAAPIFWLVAAYFPPLFADVSAGQRGGVLLLGAAASIWFEASRPSLAGTIGGAVAALKYYPAAMIIGPRPAHRVRYALSLGAVLVAVTSVSFIPLGLSGALHYYQQVLLPSLASHNSDCAYDSVRTLFTRTIGGETYQQPTFNGYVAVTSPIHLMGVAIGLSYLSAVVFAAGAVWAAWRSGWNPPYGMALGFALGALIPNEVWPYQWLPLLPLILLVAVRAVERRRIMTLALLGIFEGHQRGDHHRRQPRRHHRHRRRQDHAGSRRALVRNFGRRPDHLRRHGLWPGARVRERIHGLFRRRHRRVR